MLNTIDARRRLLVPIICRELNKLDADHWFLLNRLDRQDDDPKPGRLTSDVIVWGPTKQHVDVLSAYGAMWREHPAMPPHVVPADLDEKPNRIRQLITEIRGQFR